MINVGTICRFLEEFAPLRLAEDWDNVGLLVGRNDGPVKKIMTCLTVTPESAQEAIEMGCEMIVTHHPMPFRPLKRLTDGDTVGRILLSLIEKSVAVYSPHTAFDSGRMGINQQWISGLGATLIRPLVALADDPDDLGAGRIGEFAPEIMLAELVQRTKQLLSIEHVQIVGDLRAMVGRIAVACGAAGQFLSDAKREGCQAFLVGETNFHTCLEAEALGVSLVLPGHYASERFAVETLAEVLQKQFPEANVHACQSEHDPLKWG